MHFRHRLLILSAAAPAAFAQRGLFPRLRLPNPCEDITPINNTYYGSKFPLRNELRTYTRFGSLCPAEFFEEWAISVNTSGTYIYPPANEFIADDEEAVIIGNYGTFLAPQGAPHIERSLLPSNLITYDGNYPFNYHVYQVEKEFVVGLGPIAPRLEQPGMGTQIVAYTNALGSIKGKILRRLDESKFNERVGYSNFYTEGPNE
ncbi:hypothetical protein BDW68DRAFT_191794 [Aspergillus falconensis]